MMFKKKYRIRENLTVNTNYSFRYELQIKYKFFPFTWWVIMRNDHLSEIRYWFDRFVTPNLRTVEESDWV